MTPHKSKAHEQTYLAKDYDSFRALLIERLSAEIPNWVERSPADQTIAMLEVMAYAGDYLSYYQDAAAAEAYLATARRRTSLRRHARLLDYPVNDGANARVWVRFETTAAEYLLPKGAAALTGGPGAPTQVDSDRFAAYDGAVFETMTPRTLRRAHNRMTLAAPDIAPPTLTGGMLIGAFPHLEAGDVLALSDESAEPRHAPVLVRITRPPDILQGGQPMTRLVWRAAHPKDSAAALQEMCDSSDPRCVAEGNFVLCDHGRTRRAMIGGAAPGEALSLALPTTSLCHAGDYPPPEADPFECLVHDPRRAVAAVELREDLRLKEPMLSAYPPRIWRARRDLVSSFASSRDFVVETEEDGTSALRFGDGVQGRAPPDDARFLAIFREGGGDAGNVGRGAINQIVGLDAPISGVSNPAPAAGGLDRETAENIRLAAPKAMRRRVRCVTAEDYADTAKTAPGVHSAAAWRAGEIVHLHVKWGGGSTISEDRINRIAAVIEPLRLIGDRVIVQGAGKRSLTARCQVARSRVLLSAVEQGIIRSALIASIDAAPVGGVVSAGDLTAVAQSVARVAPLSVALIEDGKAVDMVEAGADQYLALDQVDFTADDASA